MTPPESRPDVPGLPSRLPGVLFVCTGNTARSQMAQVLLEHHAGDCFRVTSAGLEPGEVNPLTLRVLEERGLPTATCLPRVPGPLSRGTSRT